MSLTALCSRACDPNLDGRATAAPVVIDFDLKLDAGSRVTPESQPRVRRIGCGRD
jgi:hypothetical protein